jgi:carbon-monoxide dehydrogenase medium subunit
MYTMRPASFDYHRPSTLDEALSLLGGDGEVRPLAGGHSLLPALKLRLSAPDTLVDLRGIPGLDGIERDGTGLRIGALATHAQVATSDTVRSVTPVVAETAGLIGDRQVRACGTIGGSLAHADPGADYPTLTKGLGATITARGPAGERSIPADDFFTGLFATALAPGELVTSVLFPGTPAGWGAAYQKHRHPASRYAVVGIAALVSVEGGTCRSARVSVGGAVGSPMNVDASSLVGSAPSADAVRAAAGAVPGAIAANLLGDSYASAEYRGHLAEVLARKALAAAFERAGASI